MVNGVYITICDETWGPVYNAVIVPFDPSHFDDTIRFENEQYFQDSFPCTYALINAMTNPNSIADSSLFCDFNVSVHNHLAFRIDNTLTQDSVLAQTLPGRSWVDGNNHLHFIDTIELNPYYLEHATKEKVVQFILHESTHAYINFVFEQYKSHEIDSFQVKAIFPNHWEYFRYAQLGGPQTSGSQDHILMSQKYIQRMANEIKRHWSSSATSDQRNIGAEALSWSGLKDDAGWSGVSNNHYIFDTCKITAINWVSENPTASIGVSLSWGCGTYNMPYTDSLKMTTPCK